MFFGFLLWKMHENACGDMYESPGVQRNKLFRWRTPNIWESTLPRPESLARLGLMNPDDPTSSLTTARVRGMEGSMWLNKRWMDPPMPRTLRLKLKPSPTEPQGWWVQRKSFREVWKRWHRSVRLLARAVAFVYASSARS